jgi:CBS domain containing-hemolysin-like protein
VLTAWGVPDAVVRVVATTVAIAVATTFSMILGELVPKNFALAIPRQTAKLVMPFQVAFTTVFRPAITVLNGSANGILRGWGSNPRRSCPAPARRRSSRASSDAPRARACSKRTPRRCWIAP